MPRLSPAQEQQVRDRIIRAAVEVFSEKGYHQATIADVVARSGLSVGAIYTHFTGKEELFLHSCDLISGQGLDELAIRIAPLTSTAERLRTAIAYYVETIDEFQGAPGQVGLVRAWAEAGEEPGVREMLARRRERLVGAGQLLLREGIVRGEIPAWVDVDGLARGFIALLDGLLLQRIEAGDAYRPEESMRRATAFLDVLLAASTAERPGVPTA
jgi:AcrR family transcriptional regulator